MKERPILFSGPMVRALLDGTKTQTRRICKPQPVADDKFVGGHFLPATKKNPGQEISVGAPYVHVVCPYGQPGDRLWVRETWARTNVVGTEMVVYREGDNRTDYGGPWKPGIHMFRRDSRITLEVTGVRVERLQDISEADAIAEGLAVMEEHSPIGKPTGRMRAAVHIKGEAPFWASPRDAYAALWNSINGTGSWEANPWVWVVEFRRLP